MKLRLGIYPHGRVHIGPDARPGGKMPTVVRTPVNGYTKTNIPASKRRYS